MQKEILSQFNNIKDSISMLVQKGYFEEALRSLIDLEAIVPDDPDMHSVKSVIYYQLGDLDLAETTALKGLLFNPTHSDLLYNLAIILVHAGKWKRARFIVPIAIKYSQNSVLANELVRYQEEIERVFQLSEEYETEETDFDSITYGLLYEMHANLHQDIRYNVDIEYMDLVHSPIGDAVLVDTYSERLEIAKHISGLDKLFHLLEDRQSKEILVKVMAYRMMGNQKIRLPLNNSSYWNERKQIRTWICSTETLETTYEKWHLNLYNLEPVGIPIQMFNVAPGIHPIFIVKQYEYQDRQFNIKARDGDVVIDCGGCWGDTALYFANEVGPTGQVYTLEFIPSNLRILHHNLSLNPELKNRITVIPQPIWNCSNEQVFFKDRGGASLVSFNPILDGDGEIQSLSIDGLVHQHNLDRVDFIKMDIEGAEMMALNGGIDTIRKYRPTLAVSLYHSISDFQNIPDFLNQLCDDYVYTIKHSTIVPFETILFAAPKEKVQFL